LPLHKALQRVPVLLRHGANCHELFLCVLARVSPALRNSVVVDAVRQLLRVLAIQIKNSFQHMHYELHRSVVVIQKEHL